MKIAIITKIPQHKTTLDLRFKHKIGIVRH
jgi:hypothetical protein